MMVALWSVNTQTMQNVSLDARAGWLKKAIDTASGRAMEQLARIGLWPPKSYPFALFAAPEYFLAQPVAIGASHGPGSQRHIDETEKVKRLAEFQQISKSHKGMIIIPGTIAWQKPLLRSGSKQYHSKGTQKGQLKTVSRQDKATEAVNFYARRQNLQPTDRLSGQLNTATGKINAPTTQQKLDALATAGPLVNLSGVQYLARNTAYVLLDGNIIMKYNKQGDFHEVLNGHQTIHIPGKLDGRFQIRSSNDEERPIAFGIEICLDHVFQTTGKEIPHLGEVDIHIISSAQVQERQANVAVRPNGYLVHACSNSKYSGVKQMQTSWWSSSSLAPTKPLHSENVGGAPLDLWRIDLDLTRKTGSPQPSSDTARKQFY